MIVYIIVKFVSGAGGLIGRYRKIETHCFYCDDYVRISYRISEHKEVKSIKQEK